MDIVLLLHSLIRYIMLLAAIAGLVKTLWSLVQKIAPDKLDQILASAFVGLFDLQTLLGILIVFLGGLVQPVHPVVMFVGLVVAHTFQSLDQRATPQQTHLLRIGLFVVPLAIILLGLGVIGHLPV